MPTRGHPRALSPAAPAAKSRLVRRSAAWLLFLVFLSGTCSLLLNSSYYSVSVADLGGPDGPDVSLSSNQIHAAQLRHLFPNAFVWMEVAPSIDRGLQDQYLARRVPFIVRRAPEFRSLTKRSLINKFLELGMQDPNFQATTYVYEPEFRLIHLKPHELLELWLQGNETRVIDVPMVYEDLPDPLTKYNGFKRGSKLVSIQLTSKFAVTPMHSDPADNGGGWIMSVEGSKDWVFIPPWYLKHYTNNTLDVYDYFREGYANEVAALVKKLGGPPIVVAHISPGDMICWPPGWMHKVFTLRKFVGVGSYMLWPEDVQELRTTNLGHLIRQARGDPDPSPGTSVYEGSEA